MKAKISMRIEIPWIPLIALTLAYINSYIEKEKRTGVPATQKNFLFHTVYIYVEIENTFFSKSISFVLGSLGRNFDL